VQQQCGLRNPFNKEAQQNPVASPIGSTIASKNSFRATKQGEQSCDLYRAKQLDQSVILRWNFREQGGWKRRQERRGKGWDYLEAGAVLVPVVGAVVPLPLPLGELVGVPPIEALVVRRPQLRARCCGL